MSFENVKGVKITQWTATIPGNKTKELDKKIPLEYELPRSEYTIKLRLGNVMTGALMNIALVDKNGNRYPKYRYELKGKEIVGYMAGNLKNKGYMQSFYIDARNNLTPDKMKVRFSIFDEKGQLIGKEEIPFEMKTGGRYLLGHGI